MDKRFSDVKVVAWDLDTTLYKEVPELSLVFKNECIQEVARVKGLFFEEAAKIFEEKRRKWGSSSQAMEALGAGDFWTIDEIEQRINKPKYLKKDAQLPILFAELSSFRHFLISNSSRKNALSTLGAIGLSPTVFEYLITVEETGKPKPDPAPFRLLFKLTGLKPKEHVMVGDREKVDIEPAKKLGMRTILVWGESNLADLSLPTVYDIVKVLT